MKITNLRLNYYILIFGLLFGVVFYDVIQFNLGFSYTDEILAVILFFYLLLNPKRITREFLFFLCLTIFYLAHSIYDQHNILPAIFTEFFIQVKPFIAFYAVYNLNFRISEKHEKKIAKLSLVCAFLLLPVGLLNPGGGTLMDQFGGYSRYATIMIVLGTTYIIYSRQYKRKLYITLVIYSIGLLSLRSKMFGFYIAFVCVMFLWKKVSVKKLVSLKMVILFSFMIIAVIYVAKEKIEFYFIDGLFADNMFARPLLYVKAIDILNDFPFFGTGFGSYATFASAEYYSPLYYTYDLYISPEIGRGLYISDSYFPVFAQFGYVGFVLFVCFWFRLLKIAKTNFEIYNNELLFKLTILIFIFFIIESIADSTFTHNRGMVMLMLLAIILNNKYEAKDVLITSDPNLLIK